MDKAFYYTLGRIALNSVATFLVSHSWLMPEQAAYISTSSDAVIGMMIGFIVWFLGLRKAAVTVAVPKIAVENGTAQEVAEKKLGG